jgi:DNA polymerase elongation subunit (family B)
MTEIEELKRQIEVKEAEYTAANAVQHSLKIFLNSLYGCFSNEYFRLYDIRLASAVTCNGQVAIRGLSKFLETKLPNLPIVYADTDSLFLDMTHFLKSRFKEEVSNERKREFIKTFNEKVLSPLVKEYYEILTGSLNTHKNSLEMDCEVIADKTLFTVKKRYVMKLVFKDGYDLNLTGEPELKIRGIEIVRTSTPGWVRGKLKKLVTLLMVTNSNSECLDFIDAFRDEFNQLPFDQVANPRTCNGLHKYSPGTKGTPIHVRAAHVFNQALLEMKLKNFEPIRESDKLKFCYIKVPNKFGQNVISCKTILPKEIEQHIEIDYKLQFEKVALAPITGIFNALEWTVERVASLESFFE